MSYAFQIKNNKINLTSYRKYILKKKILILDKIFIDTFMIHDKTAIKKLRQTLSLINKLLL